jgi:hypothetical protein
MIIHFTESCIYFYVKFNICTCNAYKDIDVYVLRITSVIGGKHLVKLCSDDIVVHMQSEDSQITSVI